MTGNRNAGYQYGHTRPIVRVVKKFHGVATMSNHRGVAAVVILVVVALVILRLGG